MFSRNFYVLADSILCNHTAGLRYNGQQRFAQILFRKQVHSKHRIKKVKFSSEHSPRNVSINAPVGEGGAVPLRNLLKPFAFTVAVTTVSLSGAAIWEYERFRTSSRSAFKKFFPSKSKNFITKWWSGLRESEKIYFPLLAANLLVFGAWRIPRLQGFMVKYFCSNPGARNACWPMLFSTFSHYSGLHLLANMYVLYSFMPASVATLGKEQFLGMYLSAGVASSFASYLYKAITNQAGLSLGASGAIMAVLSYVCMQYPDTKLSIVFLPMFTFGAGTAIKFIIGLDTAGVLFAWKFFDHAAHLGGALFGIAWCFWGNEKVWQQRTVLLKHWHNIRESSTKT